MSTLDRFLCLVGAHRWANAVDPETGALFERCVTCGRETDSSPWARARPESAPPLGGPAPPMDAGGGFVG